MKGDFFSRLAERTLGLAPVVKPDLMPLFVATPDNAAVGDPTSRLEETHISASTPNRSTSQHRADSSLSNTRDAEAANLDSKMPQSATYGWEPASDIPERDERVTAREFEAASRDPGLVEAQKSHAPRDVVEVERHKVSRELTTRERLSLAEITDRIYAAPATMPSESSRAVNAPAPAIQISIGRVEVRAAIPSASAPRAVERKATPRLSLEQYLRERNERRR